MLWMTLVLFGKGNDGMFNAALVAGLFWATAHLMPLSTVGMPPVVANISPAPAAAAKQPILLAAVPTRAALPPPSALRLELPTAAPASADNDEREALEFVARINAARADQGLNALELDLMLTQTARAHSEEMFTEGYFDHHSPTPGLATPMDRYLTSLHELGGSQPHYLLVGENIYYCSVFNDIYNVDYAHRALMNSPGHRANILEPRFTKIGLGIHHSAAGGFWVTEMFSRDTTP